MSPAEPVELAVEPIYAEVDQISSVIDQALTRENRARVFGEEIMPFFATETARRVPAKAVIQLALLSDCLRVIDMALSADGGPTAEEVAHVDLLFSMVARFYARLRREYEPYARGESAERFLAHVREDPEPFGHACAATHWLGFDICRRHALDTGATEAVDRYERMVVRLFDQIIALGGVTRAEALQRKRFTQFLDLRKRMEATATATAGAEDPRVRGFCHAQAPEVFSATQFASQLWEHDPFDVEWVHAEAREAFERVIDRQARPGAASRDHGVILLILGESGSGKTHLMRAFRSYLHDQQLGYAGYMQMSTPEPDYAVHVLERLIDSLERPYDALFPELTGLMRLSNAVAETPAGVTAENLARVRDDDFDDPEPMHGQVRALADAIVATAGYGDFDPDLLRALLYLQRRDPISRSRVLKYLRCRPMGARDLADIGDLAPHRPGAHLRMIEQLGRLMWVTERAPLVLLLDQLEEITHFDDAAGRFRKIVTCLRHLIDHLPSALIVLSCVADLYTIIRPGLTQSTLDRIELDPDPVHISSRRTLDEIEAIVARRLAYLYDALDIRARDDNDLFPFRRADLEALANMRTRDVLDWCRSYHERCVDAGRLVETHAVPTSVSASPAQPDSTGELEKTWNDFRERHGTATDPPESDGELLGLIAWAAHAGADELGYVLDTQVEGEWLRVNAPAPRGAREILLVAMANKGARGGWLMRQLDAIGARARQDSALPVAIRCSLFPEGGKTQEALTALLQQGGRRVVVQDDELRTMLALRAFLAEHPDDGDVPAWRRTARPLTQLKALRDLLVLDEHRPAADAQPARAGEPSIAQADGPADTAAETSTAQDAVTAASEPPCSPSGNPSGALPDELLLGTTAGLAPRPLGLHPGALTRHAAFLGSTGSGKTTLALSVIEHLVGRGVPAVLIDRKGDLAGYARPGFWRDPDPERQARKQALLQAVDVRVYTPGNPAGRPLSIPVVPAAMAELPSHERSKVARHAAAALATMMQYKETSHTDRARVVILATAIELLARARDSATLDQLIDLIHNEDPALVSAIGRLDTRQFSKLVEHLTTLQLSRGELLGATDAIMDPDQLFGLGSATMPGKTRLAVISTRFLGDTASILFWVSRLLVEIGRWAGKRPSPDLRAVLFLDEADLYLPAQSKPATKEPMQDLLKRARSAGLGVLLATQSPGDLDYRCRDNIGTWFLGKIAEERAIAKMKPLFSECRTNIAGKLPGQRVGEFAMLQSGEVTPFQAERSLLDTEQLGEDDILALARGQ
jgi:GTPase SAR1 family protein